MPTCPVLSLITPLNRLQSPSKLTSSPRGRSFASCSHISALCILQPYLRTLHPAAISLHFAPCSHISALCNLQPYLRNLHPAAISLHLHFLPCRSFPPFCPSVSGSDAALNVSSLRELIPPSSELVCSDVSSVAKSCPTLQPHGL